MPSLSVVLATYNEAANITTCLTSIQDLATEIIVVDGNSTDKTRSLARSLGASVIKTTNKANFHINKQMAIDAASSDWILQLDADEVIPPPLAQEIKTLIDSNPSQNAFWINRKNFFLGRFLTKGGVYPDPVIRLFRRHKAKLPQKDVHEQLQVEGTIGQLTTPMEHYTARTFDRYLTNHNRYTSFTASQLKSDRLPLNFFSAWRYLIWLPFTTFILIYFRHKGCLDGYPGFVWALFSALHHPIAYLKYSQLSR